MNQTGAVDNDSPMKVSPRCQKDLIRPCTSRDDTQALTALIRCQKTGCVMNYNSNPVNGSTVGSLVSKHYVDLSFTSLTSQNDA